MLFLLRYVYVLNKHMKFKSVYTKGDKMIFDLTKWLLSPFTLMFLTIVTGMLFGKIKFGKFSFGVSGTLFSGLIIGCVVMKYANALVGHEKYNSAVQEFIEIGVVNKVFFSLSLILFIAAVGLLAGKDIKVVLKKYGLKFIIMGALITFVGAATTYGMTLLSSAVFDVDANPYEISGVYTGALTSSPGLAAAIESAKEHATGVTKEYENMDAEKKADVLKMIDKDLKLNNVPKLTNRNKAAFINNAEGSIGIGHAIGYPFGVIIVILAVNFLPRIFKIDVEKEKEIYQEEMKVAMAAYGKEYTTEEKPFDLIAFCTTMLFGFTLGKISIDLNFVGLGHFSLGSTGGVLIMALFFGYLWLTTIKIPH
jgi:putative transport protein